MIDVTEFDKVEVRVGTVVSVVENKKPSTSAPKSG